VDLSEFFGLSGFIVVFADTPNDPSFIQQIDLPFEEDITPRFCCATSIVVTITAPRGKIELRRILRRAVSAGADGQKHGGVKMRSPLRGGHARERRSYPTNGQPDSRKSRQSGPRIGPFPPDTTLRLSPAKGIRPVAYAGWAVIRINRLHDGTASPTSACAVARGGVDLGHDTFALGRRDVFHLHRLDRA